MSDRLVLRGGTVITMDPKPGDASVGDVLIEDGVISAVGPDLGTADTEGADVIDATGCVVMPGLVDSHRHTWQSLLRGIAADWTLGQYLTGIQPALSELFTPDDTYASILVGALEALDGGVTTLVDWSHSVNTPGHADAAVAALREAGLRAVFAHGGGADMYRIPSTVPHDEDVRRLRARHLASDDALVTMAMALRGPQFATLDVTESDIRLARELGLTMSIHVGDGEWGRTRPVARMHDRGLMGPDITYVHCNTLADDELAMIAATGGRVSISPDIEMRMGHGWPATGRLTDVGIRPGLSVDTCVSNGGDLFGTMRTTLSAQRALDNLEPGASDRSAVSLSSRDVLSFATLDGAHACHLDRGVGSIAPGEQADVVILRGDAFALVPPNDHVGQIVQAAHPGLVDTVLVAGRVVKRHGVLVGDLADRARAGVLEHRDALFARASASDNPALAAAAIGGGWQPRPHGTTES